MKELIKPNTLEMDYSEVENLSEPCSSHCERRGGVCNKYCTQGAGNNNPVEDIEILF